MGIIFRIRSNAVARSISVGLFALVLCALFLVFTDPGNISLAALLVPFLLLGVALFSLINGALMGLFSGVVGTKARRFVAAMASFVVVTILLLQSLNQFTLRDMLILLVLVATLGVYVARADFGSNK